MAEEENNHADDLEEASTLEPELAPCAGSEIRATVNVEIVAADGIKRPVFVNQFDDEILSLTLADAKRLHGFLGEAITYLTEHNERVLN